MTRNYQARAERHRDNKLKGKEERNMKRDEVKRIFPDATEEQVNQLLDINSADIGKARGSAFLHRKALLSIWLNRAYSCSAVK